MNYRYAFEKAIQLDFSSAPPPKKPGSGRRPVAAQAYRADIGYGWLDPADVLQLRRCEPPVPLYGEHVRSAHPGRFWIDLPAGHYYLTLNFGNPGGEVGPLRVLVNGRTEIERLALARGRCEARLLWITSERDHLELELQPLNGAAWQLSALSVSALGTLNEDFTLTRPWWHLDPEQE